MAHPDDRQSGKIVSRLVGEGEVKVYLAGDRTQPTLCGSSGGYFHFDQLENDLPPPAPVGQRVAGLEA